MIRGPAIAILFVVAVIVLAGIASGQDMRGNGMAVGPMIGASTINPGPPSLTIFTGKGVQAYVTIKPDGTVIYGEDYTPDAAAKALWDAVGLERKARNCQ